MATLELCDLHKAFHDHQALAGLSLRVDDGELLVLLGPSGCGKSTALRLVAGLETADRGTILLDDTSVCDLEPQERDVAMVFQSYALYPHMTVLKNIAFPLRMRGTGRSAAMAKARDAARTLGIDDLLERKPSQLSGGQQQRVALARALVRRPKLFLLDEPLSNVDARLRAEMRAELARLHGELRATMLYVTHDQVEAMTLGTRIALLDHGRLQQVGPPLVVYREPANTFVAGFLGAPPMNLLKGRAAGLLAPFAAGSIVGFRPHDARLEGPLAGKVELIEELGSETLLHVAVDGERVVVAVPPEQRVPPGTPVQVGVPPERIHRFDPKTGARQA